MTTDEARAYLHEVARALEATPPPWSHSGPGIQEQRIQRLERTLAALLAVWESPELDGPPRPVDVSDIQGT